MPPLPLIVDPESYRPCIQDLLADGEAVRSYWLDVFENHVPTLAGLPVGGGHLRDQPAWEAFREDYLSGLAALRRAPDLRGRLSVLELTLYREEKFAAHGFADPFADLKRRENDLALCALPAVLSDIDATPPPQRVERLVCGLLAGNLFDMGSKAAVDAFREARSSSEATSGRARVRSEFFAQRAGLRPRPWAVDGLDAWQDRLGGTGRPYRQALYFVDNAGSDIVLGVIPLVREMARAGVRVVLAANSRPALNDVTGPELRTLLQTCGEMDAGLAALLAADRLAVVASGCGAPLIDLSELSSECCEAAAGSDLLILEGMGRAIESNYDARFTVDTVKVALIKDKMVADVLGVELFDPVFRFEAADCEGLSTQRGRL